MAAFDEYLWIAITGILIGFLYAFGIGANDVANAFATSVASKSISLRQAVVIAAIFEFCGALFLGASVTSTVRGKIFDTEYYEDQPEVVMLGFMTSLVTASIMLFAATSFGMPVSTTHTASEFILQSYHCFTLTHLTSFATFITLGCWCNSWLLVCRQRLSIHQLA